MPQISSPTRRVLGDKDKNASLNIASPRKGAKAPTLSNSIKSQRIPAGLFSGQPILPPPSLQVGQKRSINEVDGVEVQDWSKVTRTSSTGDTISETFSDEDRIDTSMRSTAASRSMADTNMTSFSMSQEGPNSLEQHFHMPHEEMSQRVLDKFHAVPMPQNPSQPSLLAVMPMQLSGASQDSVVMSNYIDFGGSDASQRSDGLEMIEPKIATNDEHDSGLEPEELPIVQPQHEPTDEERRKSMLEEKASQLRTRLQLAYFKVRTNQTMRPLSRLKVPESMRKTPSPPSTLLSTSITAASAMAALEDMEARVSAFRARATAQARPAVKSLQSLPVPSIQPTAFSARYTDDTTTQSHPSVRENTAHVIQIPSSPPISRHSADTEVDIDQQVIDHEELPLPLAKSSASYLPNEQLSSPPASQSGDEDVDDNKSFRQGETREQTASKMADMREGSPSSVITSDAADGLLQLMRRA